MITHLMTSLKKYLFTLKKDNYDVIQKDIIKMLEILKHNSNKKYF